MQINGTFLAGGEPWFQNVSGLASYVTSDPALAVWTATTNTPAQSSGNVGVTLTDAEASANVAVKFTSSNASLSNLIVLFRPRYDLHMPGVNVPTQRCQRTGIYFPVNRIVEDGFGRQVGDKFRVHAPKEDY